MNVKSLIGMLPIVGVGLVVAGVFSGLRPTEAQTPVPVPVPVHGSLGFSGTMISGLGLRVNYTFPYSPARRVGLEPGDLIVLVNGVPIDSMVTYNNVLASSRGAVDLVIRNIRTGRPLVIPSVPLEPPAFDAYKPRISTNSQPNPSKPPRRTGTSILLQQGRSRFPQTQ